MIRRVTLGEVMGDPSNLQRTASHLGWGRYPGFEAAGQYATETVEGRRLAFAPGLPAGIFRGGHSRGRSFDVAAKPMDSQSRLR